MYPDEEGTETVAALGTRSAFHLVEACTPMKRGLKPPHSGAALSLQTAVEACTPMKRGLKPKGDLYAIGGHSLLKHVPR